MGESVVSNVALRVRESQGEISSGQSLVARSHVCCFQKTFKHQQLISTWHIKAYLNEVYQVYSFESLVFTSPSPHSEQVHDSAVSQTVQMLVSCGSSKVWQTGEKRMK